MVSAGNLVQLVPGSGQALLRAGSAGELCWLRCLSGQLEQAFWSRHFGTGSGGDVLAEFEVSGISCVARWS